MPHLFAVSSSVQPLYRLLRCINFTPQAQVELSKDGIRFSVEDSRVMQGLAFLDKDLFISFRYDNQDSQSLQSNSTDREQECPPFQISMSALLETLSIFGVTDSKDRLSKVIYASGINTARIGTSVAFDNHTLGMSGLCRITYGSSGDPLNITLDESPMTTTCSLTTYSPELLEDIPFDRDSLTLKIIMRASLLYDAVQELQSTTPERVTLACSPSANAALSLSAFGASGTAIVEFENKPELLETFKCNERSVNNYKFSMVKAASRAMAISSKVSVRIDAQGVLSLQFMVELPELEGKASFIDFRFVPFLPDENDCIENESEPESDESRVT